jgi:hypothetical protein
VGISYDLYNAPSEWAKMNTWGEAHSLPIGSPKEVKQKLEQLYPNRITKWDYHDYSKYNTKTGSPYVGAYSTLGTDNCAIGNEYIDLSVTEHIDGKIHLISVARGSPRLVREILDAFNLKYVFEAQSCTLLNPYKYKGNWEPIEK